VSGLSFLHIIIIIIIIIIIKSLLSSLSLLPTPKLCESQEKLAQGSSSLTTKWPQFQFVYFWTISTIITVIGISFYQFYPWPDYTAPFRLRYCCYPFCHCFKQRYCISIMSVAILDKNINFQIEKKLRDQVRNVKSSGKAPSRLWRWAHETYWHSVIRRSVKFTVDTVREETPFETMRLRTTR